MTQRKSPGLQPRAKCFPVVRQENSGILSRANEAERTPEAVAVSGHTVARARLDHLPAWLVLFGAR
jgi:hypothetical protein